jgi:hypothetical protein
VVSHPNRRRKLPKRVEVAVTQELIDKATANGWTGARLLAEAIKQSMPGGATGISVSVGTSRYDDATGRIQP